MTRQESHQDVPMVELGTALDPVEAQLLRVADAYLDQLHERETPAPGPLDTPEPELAECLDRRLALVQLLYEATQQPDSNWDECPADGEAEIPERFGRYRVIGILGDGGFGTVYRGFDEELRREVAVKVPHPFRLGDPRSSDQLVREARMLAQLHHPSIVRVYDVGKTAEGMPYIVSELIEGCDLAEELREGRLPFERSVRLVAEVAEAVDFAHRSAGLIHRDLKPQNILLNRDGKPHVSDFGLALAADLDDPTQHRRLVGTPHYMSPEIAGGEGHRIDGRADIYSLGVILYELLTGRNPFQGADLFRVLDQVRHHEPPAPTQIDRAIPTQLERICLKAMAKRRSDRYPTAAALASDLRHVVESAEEELGATADRRRPVASKGLRPFRESDAASFLWLIPGPRDEEGVPQEVRFWTSRIDSTDPNVAFAIGALYGPSGAGKSSLLCAGILPRLSQQVTVVLIEAAEHGTEELLLQQIQRRSDAPVATADLPASVAHLRCREHDSGVTKTLIILDQFERWLAANDPRDTELTAALRQCDGQRVQCLLVVRDDFWYSLTRLMGEVEVPLRESSNCAAVQLLSVAQARHVLEAFGRASGQLPHDRELTVEQERFLDEVVEGLSRDGAVVPVRLNVFVEMARGKPWSTDMLREIGGLDGLGVKFLEETLGAGAPARRRRHEKATRRLLESLLPDSQSAGHARLRSESELRSCSGYERRPHELEQLLQMLDVDLKLITRVDMVGEPHYQLAHDCLVAPVQQWTRQRRRETYRGRACLCLEERTTAWTTRRENRRLPSVIEWLGIGLLTAHRDWSSPQRSMMSAANRYYLWRGLLATLLIASMTLVVACVRRQVDERRTADRADALITQLCQARTTEVPGIVGGAPPIAPTP